MKKSELMELVGKGEEKQKAINALKISAPIMAMTQEEFNDYIQTLNKIMDWLEQEPCEDAISRQAVIDGIDTYINKAQSTGTQDDFYSFAELVVKELPSVTPQEPFMNKPCVAHQVCYEDKVKILDKIRAEIEEIAKDYDKFADYRRVRGLWIALEIIDKYKAESEE